ncbi:MAG: globin domain-containing protein [Parvularculaceae bacterium]
MTFDPKIIEESFAVAKPIAAEVADKFYEILWADYPQSKALFEGANMAKQKAALMNALAAVVDHLDDPQWLSDTLYKMGHRHAAYGAKDEHFVWVGASLLKTFAHFFGEAWTDELKQNWLGAYEAIAGLMLPGLRDARKGDVRQTA